MKKYLASAALAALVVSANATSLNVAGWAGDLHSQVHIQFDTNHGQEQGTYNAGAFSESINGGPSFRAFCVDLNDTIGLPTHFDIHKLHIEDLVNSHPERGDKIGQMYNKYTGGLADGIDGAGLQMAIWKTLMDGTTDFTTGHFIDTDLGADAAILAKANFYLTSDLTGTSDHAAWLKAVTHPDHTRQDMVGPCGAVPEPASVAALALGFVGIIRRRRQK